MKVTERKQCPQCAEVGQDSKGDNLAVYSDGHCYCFACGFTIGVHGFKSPVKLPKKLIPTSIPSKCIGERACSAWEIQEEYVSIGSKEIEPTGVIVFPYYNFEKRLIGLKFRDFVEEQRSGSKEIWYEGEPDLFGWHMYSSQDEVIIWEGESDCLNGWQQNPRILHLGLPGVKTAEKLIRKNAMALRNFRAVYVCMDNDDEGRSAKQVIANLLPAYSTYDMTLKESFKDLTEAAQHGEAATVYKNAIRDAKPFSLEDLLTGDELKKQCLDYLEDIAQFQGYSTGIPSFDELLAGGLHLGEVLLLVGHTGRGKSTFAAHVARQLTIKGCKVMWVGSEMFPLQMMRKFLEEYLGRKLRYVNNEYTASDQEFQDALDELCSSIVFYNEMAGDFDRLERSIITAVHQHKVNVVFLDVLSDVHTNFADWQTASEVMQRIVTVSQGNPSDRRPPIAFFCCAHTKGDEAENISLSDIRGGSAIRQKATLILSFEGDVDEQVRTLRVLKKSRMYDSPVKTCNVIYDTKKCRYKEYIEYEERDREKNGRSSRERLGIRTQEDSLHSKLSTRFSFKRTTDSRRGKGQGG